MGMHIKSKYRILFIENEYYDIEAVVEALRSSKIFCIDVVETVDEGLEKIIKYALKKENYDIIVADNHLSSLESPFDGVDLLEYLIGYKQEDIDKKLDEKIAERLKIEKIKKRISAEQLKDDIKTIYFDVPKIMFSGSIIESPPGVIGVQKRTYRDSGKVCEEELIQEILERLDLIHFYGKIFGLTITHKNNGYYASDINSIYNDYDPNDNY